MKRIVILSALATLITCSALLAQTSKDAPQSTPTAPAVQPASKTPVAKAATKVSSAKPGAKGPARKATAAKEPANLAAVLQTKLGKIVIKFFPEKAPNHVKNFQALVKAGFYNGTKFHRVIPGFMIQGGDPNTKKPDESVWGQGGNMVNGKEVTLKAEFNDIRHVRGIVSMARSNSPDSASSQFFICVADAGSLDGQYTAFGEVIEGMDVVDKIVSAPAKMGGGADRVPSLPVNPVAIDKALLEPLPAVVAAPAAPPAKAGQPAPAVKPAPAAQPAPAASGK